MAKKKDLGNVHYFRVDTVKLLHEIVDHAMRENQGVLKVPLNVLRVLLGQVAARCIELNDPVLNRLMFDLALYELPTASSPEYTKMMDAVYEAEKKYLENKKSN